MLAKSKVLLINFHFVIKRIDDSSLYYAVRRVVVIIERPIPLWQKFLVLNKRS